MRLWRTLLSEYVGMLIFAKIITTALVTYRKSIDSFGSPVLEFGRLGKSLNRR